MEMTKQGPKRRRHTRRECQRGRGGMTNRWCRMDWFSPGQGKNSKYDPTGNKILRQMPVEQESYVSPRDNDWQPFSTI